MTEAVHGEDWEAMYQEAPAEIATWRRAHPYATLNEIDHVTTSSPSPERQLQDKVIDALRRHGIGTAADIARNIRNVSSPEVTEICTRLVKNGRAFGKQVY